MTGGAHRDTGDVPAWSPPVDDHTRPFRHALTGEQPCITGVAAVPEQHTPDGYWPDDPADEGPGREPGLAVYLVALVAFAALGTAVAALVLLVQLERQIGRGDVVRLINPTPAASATP